MPEIVSDSGHQMTRLDKFIKFVLDVTEYKFLAPALLVFIPLWFSIILYIDPPTFSTGQSYSVMSEIMTEQEWAIVSFLVFLSSLCLWLMSGIYCLIIKNCILMSWHGMIAICVFLANPASTGTGTYIVLSMVASARTFHLAIILYLKNKKIRNELK